MPRKLYDDECPVFEVVDSDECHAPNGTVVEGMGESDGAYDGARLVTTGAIAVRIVNALDFQGDGKYGAACIANLGFFGCALYPQSLRPLTRAAREMLALVEGR